MSTIDRMMGKLAGEPGLRDGDAPDEPAVPDDAALPLTPAALAAASTVPEVAPLPATPPPQPVAAERAVEVPVAAPVTPPPVAPAVHTASRQQPAGRMIEVDLARLSARGYLVPGRETDQTSEQYQHIKRRLLGNLTDPGAHFDAPPNLMMITSSVPNEGKTYTSVNLALSMAMEMDRTVLAVDTDVIKQDMTRILNAGGRAGLFDYLSREDLTLPEVIFPTNIPKLSVIPAGTIRSTITERLASEAMRRLTLELAARYSDRIVLFDCPPVLATTGATALAPYIGQIVMVVEAGRTTNDTLRHALQLMEHVRLTGLILNKVKESRGEGYQYYGYKYGYQQAPG
jgi:protein-tyrosine kinase